MSPQFSPVSRGLPLSTLTLLVALLAAASHAVLLVWLWRARSRADADAKAPLAWLGAACAATLFWAAMSALDRHLHSLWPAFAAGAADVARLAAWYGLLWALMGSLGGRGGPGRWLRAATLAVLGAASIAWVLRAVSGRPELDALAFGVPVAMAGAVLGLMLVEQLVRNLPDDARWSAKPLGLALGLSFAVDVYLYAEAMLLGRLEPEADVLRSATQIIAAPLLLLATRRHGLWSRRLQLSRTVAFHSATLVFVGGYLLLMAGVGYYVRYFGGDWGRALQLSLAVAALVLLGAVLLSGSLRARLRVFIGKNFFRYRYDYREEWLRFTTRLGEAGSPETTGITVVSSLAQMVECNSGDLWTRSREGDAFVQTATWNAAREAAAEPMTGAFATFLAREGWVVDLIEFRESPRRYGDLALPAWLLARSEAFLVIPLVLGDQLQGFVTLSRPRAALEVDWEVRDLLKTAARQAAAHLALLAATESLLEARKFEAFNRMSAFVVHDLKNIVTQLALMTKNAQRLHANPEFQQDMVLTVESAVEKMRRLMLQLREGASPAGTTHGVELAPIVERLARMASERGRRLESHCDPDLATRGQEDRLERVLGHLVHNALEATQAGGKVWVIAGRRSGQVEVEVGDTGTGMDEAFIKTRLFRPFSTTKSAGMGIGTFESQQYVQELGGRIEVSSTPGQGTVMRVVLPLFVHGSEPAGAA